MQLGHLVFLRNVLKLFLKLFQGAEGAWHHDDHTHHSTVRHSLKANRVEEVEEVEQFLKVVLEGSSRQQQLVLDVVATQEPEELIEEVWSQWSATPTHNEPRPLTLDWLFLSL